MKGAMRLGAVGLGIAGLMGQSVNRSAPSLDLVSPQMTEGDPFTYRLMDA